MTTSNKAHLFPFINCQYMQEKNSSSAFSFLSFSYITQPCNKITAPTSIAQSTVRPCSSLKYSFHFCTSYLSFSNHLLHMQASPPAQCYSKNYKSSSTAPNPESAQPTKMLKHKLSLEQEQQLQPPWECFPQKKS